MSSIDISTGLPGPGLISEAVGSPAELARALRVRYYRTVCPAEIGMTVDPPALVQNILHYFNVCKEKRWPVVVLRPELKRTTWGVLVMHPPRADLGKAVIPSKLVDEIYRDIIACYDSIFNGCGHIYVSDYTYHVYQGLTLLAGETLAFRLADGLCAAMGWPHA